MVTQKTIDRINELAKKAKSPEGLTAEEVQERDALRKEYIAAWKESLTSQLYLYPISGWFPEEIVKKGLISLLS